MSNSHDFPTTRKHFRRYILGAVVFGLMGYGALVNGIWVYFPPESFAHYIYLGMYSAFIVLGPAFAYMAYVAWGA